MSKIIICILLASCLIIQYCLNLSIGASFDFVAVLAVVMSMELGIIYPLSIIALSIIADNVAAPWILGSHLIGFALSLSFFNYLFKYYTLCNMLQKMMTNMLLVFFVSIIVFIVNYIFKINYFSMEAWTVNIFIATPLITYILVRFNNPKNYMNMYE